MKVEDKIVTALAQLKQSRLNRQAATDQLGRCNVEVSKATDEVKRQIKNAGLTGRQVIVGKAAYCVDESGELIETAFDGIIIGNGGAV